MSNQEKDWYDSLPEQLDWCCDKIDELKSVILYALDIKNRQHGDDYPYDDCWEKMRKAIGVKLADDGSIVPENLPNDFVGKRFMEKK
jgi:hypothetical protein